MSEALSARLKEQGIELPKVVPPVAAYTPARKIGEGKIRTSGQLPMRDGSLVATGHVGEGEVALEDAQEAARACALNALAAAGAIAGSEDAITGVEAVTAFVSSKPDFTDQAQVANGASLFFGELFDEPHVRSAVGVAALPLGAPVEVEVVFTTK